MSRIAVIFLILFIIGEDLVLGKKSKNVNREKILTFREAQLNYEKSFWDIFAKKNNKIELTIDVDDVARIFRQIRRIYYVNDELSDVIKKIDDIHLIVQNSLESNLTEDEITHNEKSVTPNNLMDLFSKMRKQIYPNSSDTTDNLFTKISSAAKKQLDGLCNSNFSIQSELFELYKIVSKAEIKGLVILQFYNMTSSVLTNPQSVQDIESFIDDFSTWKTKYQISIKRALSIAPRNICIGNPPRHERYQTFLELERIFQYVAEAENQLANDSCTGTCETIQQTTKHSICSGTLTDCVTSVQFPGTFSACLAEPPRRYQWVTGYYHSFGYRQACWNSQQEETWFRGFVNCDYCFCLCTASESDPKTIQAISLRPQKSDIANNKVITGVKFVLKNKMIHIQIKEGKLLAAGRISTAENQTWKSLENIEWDNDGSYYVVLDEIKWRLSQETHYARISKNDNSLNLDDLTVPKNHVVTGIRFNYDHNYENIERIGTIFLEIRATSFDFVTGELEKSLFEEDHLWINNYQHRFILLSSVDNGNPLHSPTNKLVSSTVGRVNFQVSDLKSDAGQSTIPFFDAQPVEIENQGFALDGIGLSLKGQKGPSGFLTLKMSTLDLSQYIV